MKEIQRGNRFQPAYEGRLAELITAVEFTPYKGGNQPTPAGWLYLNTLDLLRNDGGWYHVRMTKELERVMQSRSIFGPTLATAHTEHYLKILKRQDGPVFLYMEFQTILGCYNLIELDEKDQAELLQTLDAAKAQAEEQRP